MKYTMMDNVLSVDIEGQRYLMESKSGKYYFLDPISIFVWERLKDGNGLEGIVNSVALEYDVDKEIVRTDIQNFVQDLIENGLLEKSS